MNSNTILIASTQGKTLQKSLSDISPNGCLEINLWQNKMPLFAQLSQRTHHLLVIDLALIDELSAVTPFFDTLNTIAPETQVILLATMNERAQAVNLLQQGVTDYLLLPVEGIELFLKIQRILEWQQGRERADSGQLVVSAGDELSMLRDASREINNSLQLDEVLRIILSKANRVAKANLAKVYLIDQHGDLSEDLSVTAQSPLKAASSEIELMFTLATEAALTLEMVYRKKTNSAEWQSQSLQSIVVFPLISADKLIGVFALGNRQADAFSANQVRWLSIFCEQAATAIENARLFQDLASAYIDLAQSREQILQSRNTLQVLFDGISDGLYILNKDLTINALNRIEAERQGYQPHDLISQRWETLAWSQAAPELLERIIVALETGEETTWLSSEQESEPYLKDREFRIYPIRNRLGQIEQVVLFAQDVSERRRWQASLFRSANLAAVGQLAGSIAHQINNPLTIAMANSQLLLLEAQPDTEIHELSTGIFKAGERIQNIVQNLLEFSNQETYFFVQTSLISTIEGALALVLRSLKKANIDVIKDYQAKSDLSASTSHLKLVWMNLLLNARDALMDQVGERTITITTTPVSKREVKVTITDNGMGIAKKDLDQIFRPFFTTKLTGKALGLGLYSAHTIIERHHGHIFVSSYPDQGTTFEVMLPLDNPRDL